MAIKKRFKLPPKCTVGEIVMRELLVGDEYAISAALDALGTEDPVARINESVRLALVEVDGVPVNRAGLAYAAFDNWNQRTMRFVTQAFIDMNGASEDEMQRFQMAGVLVSDDETAATAKAVSPERTLAVSRISASDMAE